MLTEERGAALFEGSKRWGRWGRTDELGALNLLTPERTASALTLAREGVVVSCGRPIPVRPGADNPQPAQHHMIVAGDVAGPAGHVGFGAAHDFIGVACHGMAVSHVDALCHIIVDGTSWNGRPASDISSRGARSNSIAAVERGIIGRGVLIDVPRLRGVDWLEPGEPITPDELDAACAHQGVVPARGDVVLVLTGRDARRAAVGPWDPHEGGLAGLDPECIPWFWQCDPSALGCDGVSDPLPAQPQPWAMPVHMCLLVGMGVHLLDNLDLRPIAQACAERGRWSFLFVALPLHIAGGTGSPVSPVAIF